VFFGHEPTAGGHEGFFEAKSVDQVFVDGWLLVAANFLIALFFALFYNLF
jgi:hypothetical protein